MVYRNIENKLLQKNYPKKSSQFNRHYKMLTQTISNRRQQLQSKKIC
jgi:hypothetical protein